MNYNKMRIAGILPFSDSRPSFGLVVFTDHTGSTRLTQKIEPTNGEVTGFYELEDLNSRDAILPSVDLNSDFDQAVFGSVNTKGECFTGNVDNIRKHILDQISNSCNHAYRLQAYAILDDQISTRDELGKTSAEINSRAGSRALKAFVDSAAFSIMWEFVQSSNFPKETKDSVLDVLFLVRFRRDTIGNISLDLSSIDPDLIPLINCETIEKLIHENVVMPVRSAVSAHNDNKDKSVINDIVDPHSLKSFLERRIGVDYRIGKFRYAELAKILRDMGFYDIESIERVIRHQNDDNLSHIATGNRQGQINRFEFALLAALGEEFFVRYPFRPDEEWLHSYYRNILDRFVASGVAVGTGIAQPDLFDVAEEDVED
ncbi:hypothetical protein [Brevundimonas intermedia]|uniref:hypothetical protein n=1 Tax=Brevundimonas intermedia TaxID=74315 RepID=UPI0032086237